MGTHPIFESDFDCLTEWRTMIGLGMTKDRIGEQRTNQIEITELNQTWKLTNQNHQIKTVQLIMNLDQNEEPWTSPFAVVTLQEMVMEVVIKEDMIGGK